MDKLLDGKITAEVEGYGREGRTNQAEPSTLEQLPLTRSSQEWLTARSYIQYKYRHSIRLQGNSLFPLIISFRLLDLIQLHSLPT